MMTPTVSFSENNSGLRIGTNNGTVNAQFNHTSADPLDRLPTAHGAEFDSYMNQNQDECLPGTRTELLNEITQWAASPQGKCIFWLNGMAGTGKSTISRTVAKHLKQNNLLGASFFFRRGEGDRGNAIKLFPTIIRQLVRHVPQLMPLISKAISDEPDIATKSLRQQFNNLLLHPIQNLEPFDPLLQTVIIVIDALDECEQDNDIRVILQILPQLQHLKVPSLRLRIFLTSRPELPIRLGFSEIEKHDYQDLVLHQIPEAVAAQDISLFLNHRLVQIRKVQSLPMDWPDMKDLQALVTASVPLFIFAATVCRILEDPQWDPIDSLADILSHQGDGSQFKGTYLPVLNRLLKGQTKKQENQLVDEFQAVIGVILMLESPLPVVSLSRLIDLPERRISLRLKSLHSVFSVPEDNLNLPVRLFHLSFRDFLLDPETQEETPFWVDEVATQQKLATRCLLICDSLRKNLCGLTSDGTKRAEIGQQTINNALPLELQYSCRYWVQHLVCSKDLRSMMSKALVFLHEHFLHWMEAMSILGEISATIVSINLLQRAASEIDYSTLSEFLDDAKRFILKYSWIADVAPLQLYCSGLMFTPQKAIVRRQFMTEIPTWCCQLPQVEETWSPELQILEDDSDPIFSVAFSPDSRLIVAGRGVWDVATGVLQHKLEGQPGFIQSVAFSPDGQLIASGSSDETIYLWNVVTGALQRILTGPSAIHSVAFLPNSRLLASGSLRGTLCLWDSVTGALQQTLEGHTVASSPNGQLLASTGSAGETINLWDVVTGTPTLKQAFRPGSGDQPCFIRSIAFSPNGQTIALPSNNQRILLWDIVTGGLQTLQSHSDPYKVAFSPNGQLLASCSNSSSRIIELWNVATACGTLQQTFEGHSDNVASVAFSPDGRLLVSGSGDQTARLWDLATDSTQQLFLNGHSDTVCSMAFSPNGRLLASGSVDETIHLWNPATGALQQSLTGHSDPVCSVAFSPNGQLLASGSIDQTVRLWDLGTGTLQQTLRGHSDMVSSVALSPNGQLLASGSSDQTVRLWNPITGALQQILKGHSDPVLYVTFSPDCRLIASSSSDRTVRLWDTATGAPYQTLQVFVNGHINHLEFSQHGSHIFTNLGTLNIQHPGCDDGVEIFRTTRRNLDISIEHGQWIILNGKPTLWLPPSYRSSCFAVSGNLLAMGHRSGRVSFIGFRF